MQLLLKHNSVSCMLSSARALRVSVRRVYFEAAYTSLWHLIVLTCLYMPGSWGESPQGRLAYCLMLFIIVNFLCILYFWNIDPNDPPTDQSHFLYTHRLREKWRPMKKPSNRCDKRFERHADCLLLCLLLFLLLFL